MPPKAVRGKLARGGGRGRGKALAPDPEPEVLASQIEGPASQSTIIDSLRSDSLSKNIPQYRSGNLEDENLDQGSPNSSTITVPTETPTTTPIRAPPQISEGSSSAVRGGAAARGRGDGSGAAKSTKFKPKARRRDVSERQKLELEEQARIALHNRNAAAEQKIFAPRGRGRAGRAGRGRGDAMGRGTLGLGRSAPLTTASGPFSAAPDTGELCWYVFLSAADTFHSKSIKAGCIRNWSTPREWTEHNNR